MVQRSLLILAIRIAAIFILIGVVQKAPDIVTALGASNNFEPSSHVWYREVIPQSLLTLLAIFMWIRPESLIGKLTPADTPLSDSENFSHMAVFLFAAIGLYITATGLDDFVYFYLIDQFITERFPDNDVSNLLQYKAGMYASAFQVVMGIAVMFGSKVLTRFFITLRTMGTEKS